MKLNNTTELIERPFYRGIETELKQIRIQLNSALQSDDEQINQLCEHAGNYHGKMLRSTLLLLSGQACGGITQKHIDYATVVELLHLATLIHDDVLDEAVIRRNSLTTRQLWGNESSVLLGDYLLSKAFDLCNELGDLDINKQISDGSKKICQGELLQCLNRQNWKLSEEQYLKIIDMKTGELYKLCGKIGAEIAGGDSHESLAMSNFGSLIGQSFQISDDLLDILGEESETGKTLGSDLNQGKPTLPTIHFLRESSPKKYSNFMELVTKKNPANEIDEIRALLKAVKSLQYTKEFAWNLIEQAKQELQNLKASQAKESLATLAEFVVKRSC